ncbi:MAG: hypothetical protein LKE39_07105 [Sphaerochaeta sp.]|jgi:hypothetical protein|nr:hypothetical protein [Sphaerochaeta sp.]
MYSFLSEELLLDVDPESEDPEFLLQPKNSTGSSDRTNKNSFADFLFISKRSEKGVTPHQNW